MSISAPTRRTVLAGLTLTAGTAAKPSKATAMAKPILVFDITETILDTASLEPVFASIFGDPRTVRTWFDEVIIYAEALTITGGYADVGTIGVAVLEMLAKSRGLAISPDQRAAFRQASGSLPAYPDVAPGLSTLTSDGYRLVTLSNSPIAACESQLRHAGIRDQFERLFAVDERVRRFKPARETYAEVARELEVGAHDLMLVTCHAFDTMGAAAAGLRSALILRPGNAPFDLGPQPALIVPDLLSLARALGAAATH